MTCTMLLVFRNLVNQKSRQSVYESGRRTEAGYACNQIGALKSADRYCLWQLLGSCASDGYSQMNIVYLPIKNHSLHDLIVICTNIIKLEHTPVTRLKQGLLSSRMKLLYISAGKVTSTTWPTTHPGLWLATTTAPRRGSADRPRQQQASRAAGAAPSRSARWERGPPR